MPSLHSTSENSEPHAGLEAWKSGAPWFLKTCPPQVVPAHPKETREQEGLTSPRGTFLPLPVFLHTPASQKCEF